VMMVVAASAHIQHQRRLADEDSRCQGVRIHCSIPAGTSWCSDRHCPWVYRSNVPTFQRSNVSTFKRSTFQAPPPHAGVLWCRLDAWACSRDGRTTIASQHAGALWGSRPGCQVPENSKFKI